MTIEKMHPVLENGLNFLSRNDASSNPRIWIFSILNSAFTTDKDEDEINLWWSVDDMFTFDNIGFR